MSEFYKSQIPIYEPDNLRGPDKDALFPPNASYGLVRRDYGEYPEQMFAQPDEMGIIPSSEWDARFDEQERLKSSLEHMYLGGLNGAHRCSQSRSRPRWILLDLLSWSLGDARQDAARAEVVRLNPHSQSGSIIKDGRNEGGWCGLGAQFVSEHGMAPEGTGPGEWPKWSRDLRQLDTAEMRASMANYRIDEQWTDVTRRMWDRNLTTNQVAPSGFNNLPGPRDYNWWAHSVCGIRWVRIERGSWGQLILNSWKNWGHHGLAVLRGNRAICDGGLTIRTTT
jgi:hypothetical protein